MASVVNEGGGRRTIQLSEGEQAGRPKIRLGKVSARQAAMAQLHIEKLITAHSVGGGLETATLDWLADLPNGLRKRLERVGLVAAKARANVPTLGKWLDEYTASRRDVKTATATVYGHTVRNMLAFFGGDKLIDEITPGDADGFRVFLKTTEGLSDNTVARRIGIARQFINAAIRRKLLMENPFIGQTTAIHRNRKREYFVTPAQAEAILAACPEPQWRLVFALCRYGALRCASELVRLTWADVDWERMRLTVYASKTEHHDGAGVRQLPIFEELYPHLLAAYEAAEPGAVYCCPQYRADSANRMYHKALVGMLKAAGIKPWPKLAQNCRSSREGELVAKHPLHVVCEWLGHSPVVAAKHYLRVTDGDFEKAAAKPVASGEKSGAENGAESGASHSGLDRTAPQAGEGEAQKSPVLQGFSGKCDEVQNGAKCTSGRYRTRTCGLTGVIRAL